MTYKLALGLIDNEKSYKTLINLIGETEGEIFKKDYKEWKKVMNIRD